MSDFETLDFRTYEESWQEPHPSKQPFWQELANNNGSIPQPLYRLHVSILVNEQGRTDCPIRILVYPTLEASNPQRRLSTTPSVAAPPSAKIEMGGVEPKGIKTTFEQMMPALNDGRTETCVPRFDTQNADKTWVQSLKRLNTLEERWTIDNGDIEAEKCWRFVKKISLVGSQNSRV